MEKKIFDSSLFANDLGEIESDHRQEKYISSELNVEEMFTLIRKSPPNRKAYFDQKAALQSAPFKSAKITGFFVRFS
jgi:hypothetical protein